MYFQGEKLVRFGRNDRCPCESGKKFKKCHMNTHAGDILKNANGKWFVNFIIEKMKEKQQGSN